MGASTQARRRLARLLARSSASLRVSPLQVDFYFACHNHNYETTWPLRNGTLVAKSYHKPTAPFYITSGAAGPPDLDPFGPPKPWTRSRIGPESGYDQAFTYSRMAFTRSEMRFEQVATITGKVLDSFTVTK